MEDHSQEGPTQQVSQSCEVGDGAVVRVDPSGPHAVHHHAGQVEQQADLGENTSLSKINAQGGGGGGYLQNCSGKVEDEELEGEN